MHKDLVEKISNGNEQAFQKLFIEYYTALVNFAYSYLKSKSKAESVVQEVFADFWEERESLDPSKNIETYLFQAVKFKSYDVLKHKKVVNKYRSALKYKKIVETDQKSENDGPNKKLIEEVQKAIKSLPDRAKRVFVLHRKEGLTYKEIAYVMDISKKTVESQMSRALKLLRNKLDEFIDS